MKKFYFCEYSTNEKCYEKSYWYDYMCEEELDELELVEAVKVKDNTYFYCKSFGIVCEKGSCGKTCSNYNPRNGKSGICKHQGILYENAGKTIIIKNENSTN